MDVGLKCGRGREEVNEVRLPGALRVIAASGLVSEVYTIETNGRSFGRKPEDFYMSLLSTCT